MSVNLFQERTSRESALRAAFLTAILSFSAGIIGTSHHYFWFGQSSIWIALGSVFSSLEPVPFHGHTALFGAYGVLAIALALFVWRGLVRPEFWREKWLKCSFWGINGGLALMFLIALLPVGVMEFVTSYREGLWLAKSAWFFGRPAVQLLGNLRAIPDTVLILFGPFRWRYSPASHSSI